MFSLSRRAILPTHGRRPYVARGLGSGSVVTWWRHPAAAHADAQIPDPTQTLQVSLHNPRTSEIVVKSGLILALSGYGDDRADQRKRHVLSGGPGRVFRRLTASTKIPVACCLLGGF